MRKIHHFLLLSFVFASCQASQHQHEQPQQEEQNIDDEIASLDELIRLQQMKLNLLKSKKNGDAGRQQYSAPIEPNIPIQRSEIPSRSLPHHVSTGTPEKSSFEANRDGKFEDHLIPRYRFKLNFTIASYHLLTCVAKAIDKNHHSRMTVLALVIDTDGILHILNPQAEGEEMATTPLLSFHGGSRILVSDVEGDSEEGPILVTGAEDGSLHVLGIQVNSVSSPSTLPVLAVECHSLHQFSLRAPNSPSRVIPTALHLYYRGSQRGLGIYIGDSYCRFSSYSINGTFGGRVAATAEKDSYSTIEQLSGEIRQDPNEISFCGPREHDGVGKMTRIGQVIAAPVGHSVLMLHISRLNVVPRVCTGGSERITQAVIDLKAMSYVLAKTVTGSILTFNTKAQTGRNSDIYCELVRVQPPLVIQPEPPVIPAAQTPTTLISLRGAMIDSSGCTLSVINTTNIKKSRFGSSVAAIQTLHEDCQESPLPLPSNAALVPFSANPSPLWLDISPRYQRDFFAKPSLETLISVAYNLPTQPTEQSCGSTSSSSTSESEGECQLQSPPSPSSSSGSELIIFLSLITPLEEPDELSWIKWPMLGFGVGAFLLFKIFFPGTKFPKKTSSRFGKHNFVGSTSTRGLAGRFNSAEATAELRRELDDLDNMTSRLGGRGPRSPATSDYSSPFSPSTRLSSRGGLGGGLGGRYDD